MLTLHLTKQIKSYSVGSRQQAATSGGPQLLCLPVSAARGRREVPLCPTDDANHLQGSSLAANLLLQPAYAAEPAYAAGMHHLARAIGKATECRIH